MKIERLLFNITEAFKHIIDTVPIFVWIFCGIAAFCLYKAISEANYDCKALSLHFGDRFKTNSPFNKKFYEIVHRVAVKESNARNAYELDAYEDELYDKMDALIFEHDFEFSKEFIRFNPDFCSWILDHHPDAKVYDFPTAVISYRRYVESQRNQQYLDEIDAERRRADILCAIDKIKSERAAKLYSERQMHTTKHDIVTAYNDWIQKIKADPHSGLLPVKIGELPQSVYRCLYTTVVLSHQILQKVFAVDYSEIDVCGCAIIFNTYTERYLIIKSSHIYTAIKNLLQGNDIEYASTFGADLLLGHLPLVRVVPLEKSGYVNLDFLYKSLIRSYDSCEPRGYNFPKSLDI